MRLMLTVITAVSRQGQWLSASRRGQGIVEYAGALVVGAVTVSVVLAVAPGNMSGLFMNVLNTIQTFFTGFIL